MKISILWLAILTTPLMAYAKSKQTLASNLFKMLRLIEQVNHGDRFNNCRDYISTLNAKQATDPEEFTEVSDRAGTEPCVESKTNKCTGKGTLFSDSYSLVWWIGQDLNKTYNSTGHFVRVSDKEDQIWQTTPKAGSIAVRIRSGYAGHKLAFGTLDFANNIETLKLSGINSGQAKSRILLKDCSNYTPLHADNKKRCAMISDQNWEKLHINPTKPFEFAMQRISDAEALNPWIAKMAKKIGVGTNTNLDNTVRSYASKNKSKKDQMVTYRFSQPLPIGPNGKMSLVYLVAFAENTNTPLNPNDLIMEIRVPLSN